MVISSHATALAGASATPAPGNATTLKSFHESNDGTENYRTFEFEVSEPGDYHVRFWLQPAMYPDGSFTRYKVSVNNEYTGTIATTYGTWQSAMISDVPTITLAEGTNAISVSTVAPEFPEVESIKLSQNATGAEHSADAYDSFMINALGGTASGNSVYSVKGVNGFLPESTTDGTFQNIPLKYSFYKTFSFTANEEISVTSTSHTPHVIDIFYYGKRYIMAPIDPIDTVSPMEPVNSSSETNGFVIDTTLISPPIDPGIGKAKIAYTTATPEETQGLNWKAVSEPALNNANIHIASKSLTIPKTGLYMIKLRSASDRTLGVADVNINNSHYYEDSPIYYAKVSYSIPSSTSYAVMTVKDGGDPMLFMEGNDAQRIVGYDDDAPADSIAKYGLTSYDAFILQSYRVRTTGMHVCNYSSSDPESTCKVTVRLPDTGTTGDNSLALKSRGEDVAGLTNTVTDNATAVYPSPASASQPITIAAGSTIHRVCIYNLSGNMVADIAGNSECITIHPAENNITRSGIYIFSIETDNGTTSHKLPISNY